MVNMGLEYEDGILRTAIVDELANSEVSMNLYGAGAITCANEEACEDEIINALEADFCIYG
ncbi:MAG: hypothetical protein MRQ07_04505 [Candidatus Midichloria sp.]|nr:hypothetical protein [Candidatus Midichloria sp.]